MNRSAQAGRGYQAGSPRVILYTAVVWVAAEGIVLRCSGSRLSSWLPASEAVSSTGDTSAPQWRLALSVVLQSVAGGYIHCTRAC